jgi:uncharacterized protein
MIRDDIKAATIDRHEERRQGNDRNAADGPGGDQEPRHRARTGGAPADDDQLVTEVLQKMIKQRRESAEAYRKGGREDRAGAEEAEIAVIERFLPRQMSDEEARNAIAAIIADTGAARSRTWAG